MVFDQKLLDISQSFAGAEDKKTLLSIADRAFAQYGCDHFIFADVAPKLPLTDFTLTIFHTTMPHDFWDVVKDSNLRSNSVKLRRFITRKEDSFWDDPKIAAESSAAELAMTRRVAEAGFERGYFAGFEGRAGYRTVISMHLDQYSKSDLALYWPELQPKLNAIGQMLDAAFFNNHVVAHYGLAPRERDVLAWLSAGLRPDEIADKLAIGYRSVDKYIVSAKEKLNARTRDHAVSLALILGLI
jgi:DNA-binding CsgD family transcriptional regulator